MSSKQQVWGCCEIDDENLDCLNCNRCGALYHFACVSNPEIQPGGTAAGDWICTKCSNSASKPQATGTPARNVSIRGTKRPALNSPPEVSETAALTALDVRSIMKEEMGTMLKEFTRSVYNTVNRELEPIKSEMRDFHDTLSFMNERFEQIITEHAASQRDMKQLKVDNQIMKDQITELTSRLNYLEQQTRSNNLELQCVPEHKTENLYTTVIQLGKTVNCLLQESDILHATRVAKRKNDNQRPRSIVVQLASPKIRDRLLASTIQFNKNNANDKLNSTHLGIASDKMPIYVVEHLSPYNRELHAATRRRAKEKEYKFVWVRAGKIFARKNEESEYILIKSMDSLTKIV